MQKTVSQPLESHLSRQIRGLDRAGQRALALSHLEELGSRYSSDTVELFRQVFGRTGDVIETDELRDWLSALPVTSNASHLKALLSSDLDLPEASSRWRAYFEQRPDRQAIDLLLYARALADEKQFETAAAQLRTALASYPPYPFFTRAEKLLARVSAALLTNTRDTSIAVLGNTTTGFLMPVLKALCLRDRISAKFYEGLYGSQSQEILDSAGALENFRPAIVILPISWRDLPFPAFPGSAQDDASQFAKDWVSGRTKLWERLAARFQCHIVQFAVDYPLQESYGLFGNTLPAGRTRAIEAVNRELWNRAPGYVSILDTAALQRSTGAMWEDAQQWSKYQQHPASAALPELAEAVMAHIRAALGLTRKIMVVDLDNTLWKGVIGEDGLSGIQVGPGSPAGEAHLQLQRYLRELKDRGILLAVSSKNNPEDARLPFKQHTGMLLRLDDFAAFRANWEDKAANIRQIAADLSLGLDSFVFLDDNPLEREWVRSQIPELTVVELGPSVFHYVRDLDRGRYFEAIALSVEDLARANQYRNQSARESIRATYDSMDDYLGQLQLEASVEPVTRENLGRVAQLINKTNQFNVTTRRYTEAQVWQAAEDSPGWVGAFRMADRFGSYGLIGVLICRAGADTREWEIDSWLMSCRTLGRQMEKFMFDRLVEAARGRGIEKVIGVYRPTAKNKLVATLFEQMSFTRTSETNEEIRYLFRVPEHPLTTATHVRNTAIEQLAGV